MRWISVIYSANHPEAEDILKICQDFTPKVYIQTDRFETPVQDNQPSIRHQGLLLEVHASFRLFGGEENLMWQLWERLNSKHANTPQANKLGSASTAWLAWCLGKTQPDRYLKNLMNLHLQPCEQEEIERLPVQALDLSIPDRQLMLQCGFETVGNLMRQAREELARRFGLRLLQQLDLLTGQGVFTPSSHAELEVHEDQEEMPFHATEQSRIEKVIYQLLCRLESGLIHSKQKAERLDFVFVQAHDMIPMQVLSAHGLQRANDWALLVQYQLSRMKFQDDIRWIKLRCEHLTPAFDHNGTWLPDPNTDKEQWIELCDKLKARLGNDAVKQAFTVPDPRPELGFEYRRLGANGKADNRMGQGGKARSGIVNTNLRLPESAVRPLWLLPAPQRLKGKAPDWNSTGEWRLLSGPERIDFGWWDKQACKRDYYRALNKEVTQAWLFCEEEFHQGKSFLQWYIHGYFG